MLTRLSSGPTKKSWLGTQLYESPSLTHWTCLAAPLYNDTMSIFSFLLHKKGVCSHLQYWSRIHTTNIFQSYLTTIFGKHDPRSARILTPTVWAILFLWHVPIRAEPRFSHAPIEICTWWPHDQLKEAKK